MVELTAQAGVALGNSLPPEEVQEKIAFRFTEQESGGITLTKGGYETGDIELEHEGDIVLRVPSTVADQIGDVMVDVAPAEDGSGGVMLVLRRPAE